ncbi:MAG TPA: hypothetical protein VFV34_11395, partial [Blastocatellia bacterium]|nr:hypothetical protein [Blastocatellia bacterium]
MSSKKDKPVAVKSVVIHQLRALAVELRRTPNWNDVRTAARQKKCPAERAIRAAFGTLREALKAARIPLNVSQEFSEQELISQLQDLSRALERPLTERDIVKAAAAGTCARLATFTRVFGSAGRAFRTAGVSPVDQRKGADLIVQYRALAKELGRLPTTDDIRRAASEGKCAGYGLFKKHWGRME